jgi:integrase
MVKQLPEHNRRLRYLSVEECQGLVQACLPHLKPIVVTALNTGMRKEEVLSLRWDKHVDLKHGFILLDTTKSGERREIPINDTLRQTLQALVRRVDSPYVFTGANGKRFLDVKRAFHSACQRADIKDFTFHDLRHTFASHLVMAGVDLPTVKELLGHKTLSMTLRYAHLAPSHKVKAVAVLGESLNGTQSIQKVDSPTKKGLAATD